MQWTLEAELVVIKAGITKFAWSSTNTLCTQDDDMLLQHHAAATSIQSAICKLTQCHIPTWPPLTPLHGWVAAETDL